MMRNLLVVFLFHLIFINITIAQPYDSTGIKISLLTCAPGEELYSTFGHTAIRVVDQNAHTDYVFNYGLFDFNEPNFYMKFVRGQLKYMLGMQTFEEFLYEYQITNRSVWEQDIALNEAQKQKVISFLFNNLKEENRYYNYDFVYDNCATRARDVFLNVLPGYNVEKQYIKAGTTARDLFHYYLDNGKNQAWSKLGIDILLGSGIDTAMNKFSGMFLPEFLMNAFDVTTYQGIPIVLTKRTVVHGDNVKQSNYYVPFITILIISILLFAIYYFKRKNVFFINVLDSILLFVTGTMGLLLLFMWFFTDHPSTKNNYNLLWALPTNIVFAFSINKINRSKGYYWLLAIIITTFLVLCWFFLPQEMNFALLPFVLLMGYRYSILYFNARKNNLSFK